MTKELVIMNEHPNKRVLSAIDNLPPNPIFSVLVGSRAIGLHKPDSDYDVVTVYMESHNDLFGFHSPKNPLYTNELDKPFFEKKYVFGEWQIDHKWMTLREFMRRAFLQCNQTIIETLWANLEMVHWYPTSTSTLFNRVIYSNLQREARRSILGLDTAKMYYYTARGQLENADSSLKYAGAWFGDTIGADRDTGLRSSLKQLSQAYYLGHCGHRLFKDHARHFDFNFEMKELLEHARFIRYNQYSPSHYESSRNEIIQLLNLLREKIENWPEDLPTKNIEAWNDLCRQIHVNWYEHHKQFIPLNDTTSLLLR